MHRKDNSVKIVINVHKLGLQFLWTTDYCIKINNISSALGKISDFTMDVYQMELSISDKRELHSLCCMMGETMSLQCRLLAANDWRLIYWTQNKINTFAATDALARQHGATSHPGDALGRQSSMISTVIGKLGYRTPTTFFLQVFMIVFNCRKVLFNR